MITFLLSMIVLAALVFTGYRVNMYLYSQGVVGTSSQVVNGKALSLEELPMKIGQKMAMRERDDSLRFARLYLVLIMGLAAVLVIIALGVLSSVFH